MPTAAPYGSWKSPIAPDMVTQNSVRLGPVALDGDDIYWVEERPRDGARNVVVRRSPDGTTQDITSAPRNVRTRVHEYGGLCFWVSEGTLLFSNFSDGRVYRQEPSGDPAPLTPEGVDLRYADGMIDRARNRLICVREDHRESDQDCANEIVALDLDGYGERRGSGIRKRLLRVSVSQPGWDRDIMAILGSPRYALGQLGIMARRCSCGRLARRAPQGGGNAR